MKHFAGSLLSCFIFVFNASIPICASAAGGQIGNSAVSDTSSASAEIKQYSLQLSISDKQHSFSAEAQMWIRLLKDSLTTLHFSFNKILDFDSARDSTGTKFSKQITKLEDGTSDVAVSVPDTLHRGDSLFLRLRYDAEIDSPMTASAFITDGNIILPSNCDALWWPVLSPEMNLSEQKTFITLTAVLPSSYSVVSSGECDTSHSPDGMVEWRFRHAHEMPLKSAFLLCASKEFVEKSFVSADSSVHISLYFSPALFNTKLAGYLMRQLGTAADFFSLLTLRPPQHSHFRFVAIGNEVSAYGAMAYNAKRNGEGFSNGGTFVMKNSPAFAVDDSSSLQLSADNMWVHNLAHAFNPVSSDSTYWFSEGWASYLSARFFLDKIDTTELQRQHERLRLMAGALDFYPTYPLAALRQHKNETAVYSRKGAYVFLMLEYLLGKELFDDVIHKMYTDYRTAPITISEFQKLCEDVYGTPLDWFFNEWVYRTGFPEFVFSSDTALTARGSYSVKAHIFQRGDVFVMPADVVMTTAMQTITKRVFLQRQDQGFEFIIPEKPLKVDLDPDYKILRWIPRLRLVAHARTSESYRVFDHDLVNSEREALLTLQLDPNNLTGSNPLALFSLGKIAMLRNDLVKAEAYFRQASLLESAEPAHYIPLLSLVRLGNVLEMEGRREESLQLYQQALSAAELSPVEEKITILEAKKYLQEKFISSEEFWYGKY
jgi:tetratricopeptide (TPR) repeat protein